MSTPAALRGLADDSTISGAASVTFAHAGKTTDRLAMDAFTPTTVEEALPLAPMQLMWDVIAEAAAAADALMTHAPACAL